MLEPELLLLEPGRVVALPGYAVTAVELQDPARHVVEEVPVVGDRDDRALILLEVVLQPGHGLGVQVVGRFVEEQDVGFLEEEPAQGHPALLAAGEHLHRHVRSRAAQGIHGHVEARLDVPRIQVVDPFLQLALAGHEPVHLVVVHGLGELHADLVVLLDQVHGVLKSLLHDLPDGLVRVELRLLFEEAQGVPGREHRLALILLVQSRHDAKQGALARAIQSQHADLGPIEVGQGDVLDDLPVLAGLADPHHGVDDLFRSVAHGQCSFKGYVRSRAVTYSGSSITSSCMQTMFPLTG